MDTKLLFRENIPCWYELSWNVKYKKKPVIILRVHREFIDSVEKFSNRSPIIGLFKKEFDFTKFEGFHGNFGFDDAFKKLQEKDGFVEFMIPIPVVEYWTDNDCKNCSGSGRDNLGNGRCFSCKGKGKESIYSWKPVYAVSASFSIFSRLSQFPEVETSSSLPQLLQINTDTEKGMHGTPLFGSFSPCFVKWLSSFKEGEIIPEMIEAMKVVSNHMIGLSSYNKYDFRAQINDEQGWLNVSCPGDACGIYKSGGCLGDKNDGGYKFSCHNMDTPMQQLTLIAGLAALHDKARKEIKI